MASADPQATAAPVCPRHPDTIAYVRCQRCERPTCPKCQVPAPVGILCDDCVRDANRAARPVRSRLGFVVARGTPWVTYGLIIANAAFFILGPMLLGRNWGADLGLWPDYGLAVEAAYPAAGDEWWRWLTAGFVHFGVIHVAMNMVVLWQFGTQLEPALGRLRFGILYFVSLLGGSLAVVLFHSAAIGASG